MMYWQNRKLWCATQPQWWLKMMLASCTNYTLAASWLMHLSHTYNHSTLEILKWLIFDAQLGCREPCSVIIAYTYIVLNKLCLAQGNSWIMDWQWDTCLFGPVLEWSKSQRNFSVIPSWRSTYASTPLLGVKEWAAEVNMYSGVVKGNQHTGFNSTSSSSRRYIALAPPMMCQ